MRWWWHWNLSESSKREELKFAHDRLKRQAIKRSIISGGDRRREAWTLETDSKKISKKVSKKSSQANIKKYSKETVKRDRMTYTYKAQQDSYALVWGCWRQCNLPQTLLQRQNTSVSTEVIDVQEHHHYWWASACPRCGCISLAIYSCLINQCITGSRALPGSQLL